MNRLHLVDNEYTESLQTEGLFVTRGWNKGVMQAVINGSRETNIVHKTPNDALKRFTDETTATRWYEDEKKQPVVYALVDQAIGGFAWFSQQHTRGVGGEVTFGIRIYESLRGRRLAGRFLEAVHQDYTKISGYRGNIWLETDAVLNAAAFALYAKHGYEMSGQVNKKYVMTRPYQPAVVRPVHREFTDAELTVQYNASHDLNNL